MTEHIVAVFTAESTADAAARDLEHAGFSAIRRYRPGANEGSYGTSRVGSPQSTLSDGGGFWAWLLGEEPATGTTQSLYRDGHAYDQWAQTGKSVLSVMVDDDLRIHQAVTILEAYHPIELEEGPEEGSTIPYAIAAMPQLLAVPLRPPTRRSFRSLRRASKSANALSTAARPECGATWWKNRSSGTSRCAVSALRSNAAGQSRQRFRAVPSRNAPSRCGRLRRCR